jgi:CheY-like chemotaxis protein
MGPQNRKRILLVEDHAESRELVEFSLKEYAVICASDFDEGLSLAQQQKFDLFILDNWLPDRSGVELCRIIREFDPHTPILFCSSAAYGRDISEARDLVILNASSLFRRNALRGRPFTIPGRGRLRHLLVLRLFSDLAVLLGPLRRFGALPQELDVAGVNFQADALNALAIGVLFAA